jgi:hypothetical protein
MWWYDVLLYLFRVCFREEGVVYSTRVWMVQNVRSFLACGCEHKFRGMDEQIGSARGVDGIMYQIQIDGNSAVRHVQSRRAGRKELRSGSYRCCESLIVRWRGVEERHACRPIKLTSLSIPTSLTHTALLLSLDHACTESQQPAAESDHPASSCLSAR